MVRLLKIGSGYENKCFLRQILSIWLVGYSRLWLRVVLLARQPMNPGKPVWQPYARVDYTVSSQTGTVLRIWLLSSLLGDGPADCGERNVWHSGEHARATAAAGTVRQLYAALGHFSFPPFRRNILGETFSPDLVKYFQRLIWILDEWRNNFMNSQNDIVGWSSLSHCQEWVPVSNFQFKLLEGCWTPRGPMSYKII